VESQKEVEHTPLLEVRNVHLQRDGTTILRDFSWRVKRGENWVVFGPNGAGKTSLLNVIQGYLWPSEGGVWVLGGRLGDGVDVRDLRTHIAVVSDAVKTMVHEELTGLEVLVTGARAHLNIFDPPKPEELELAQSMAEMTNIEPLLTKPFGVMSSGERQRVMITRALMLLPEIVVLDEPCAALDLAGREWVLQTIENIVSDPNAPTVLLTTHHVEEITPSFSHALLLRQGERYAAGPLQKVFTSEALTELFHIPLHLEQTGTRWRAEAKWEK